MSKDNGTSAAASGGVFLPMLAVLFIGLKLTGVINWSWWWVLAPLWGGFALAVLILLVALVVMAIKAARK